MGVEYFFVDAVEQHDEVAIVVPFFFWFGGEELEFVSEIKVELRLMVQNSKIREECG